MSTLASTRLFLFRPLLMCLALVTFLGAGCAQFSEKECTTGDWRSRGVNDGKRGLVKHVQFDKYAEICEQAHGVTLRSEAYFSGYDEGLELFCSESNGRSLGRKGVEYLGVCTPALEPAFMAGYKSGLESYCTPTNGAQLGGQFRQYKGVCPQNLQRAFLLGFVPALEASLPMLESNLFYLDRRLSNLESRLALDRIELRHQHSELAGTRIQTAEYRKRKDIIARITRENRQLEADIRGIEGQLAHLETKHAMARQQLITWRPLMRK